MAQCQATLYKVSARLPFSMAQCQASFSKGSIPGYLLPRLNARLHFTRSVPGYIFHWPNARLHFQRAQCQASLSLGPRHYYLKLVTWVPDRGRAFHSEFIVAGDQLKLEIQTNNSDAFWMAGMFGINPFWCEGLEKFHQMLKISTPTWICWRVVQWICVIK